MGQRFTSIAEGMTHLQKRIEEIQLTVSKAQVAVSKAQELQKQREIIREEYVTEEEVNVRASEILRTWGRKRLYDVGSKQKRGN